ncbi:MAG: flagellar basal body rod protein FlgB [Lautropia sp.]|nr:flagellar basal body rod protein FlgB [Lautropia sp.]
MLDQLTESIDFHGQALKLRASRQEVISSNIANTDTPNFKARDFDFGQALREATGMEPAVSGDTELRSSAQGGLSTVSLARTRAGHQQLGSKVWSTQGPDMKYVVPEQPSMDGNTVDLNRERAQFSQNAVNYEASLRFINGKVRTMMSAIRGE